MSQINPQLASDVVSLGLALRKAQKDRDPWLAHVRTDPWGGVDLGTVYAASVAMVDQYTRYRAELVVAGRRRDEVDARLRSVEQQLSEVREALASRVQTIELPPGEFLSAVKASAEECIGPCEVSTDTDADGDVFVVVTAGYDSSLVDRFEVFLNGAWLVLRSDWNVEAHLSLFAT